MPAADACLPCHRTWWPACAVHACAPYSAATRCSTPQLWRWARMNEIDWQYLACSCIAYNHHMMSWACASQLCAAGAAHEPP
jgi:hypothetical protein